MKVGSNESFFWSYLGHFEENVLKQILASGLIFQGIGFGWLFFLLFQEWRSRKRGTMM